MIKNCRQCSLFCVVVLLMALVVCWSAQAATNYVTPSGDGSYDGSDWDNAYSNIQDAVDASTASGDLIYLKSGTYTNFSSIGITNHPGLTIVGGYLGDGGTSTNLDTNATIITRSPTVTNRIFDCSASTTTLWRVTVTNGLTNTNTPLGAGLYLFGCQTTITNCAIRGNSCAESTAHYYGGGIYASGGWLGIFNSDISRNSGNNLPPAVDNVVIGYGGGIYAINVSVTLKASTITSNSLSPRAHRTGYGGGLYLNGGNALLDGCPFRANWISASYNGTALGGGIYASGVGSFTITNCTFTGNFVSKGGDDPGGSKAGDVIYIINSGTNLITDCVLLKNGVVDTALEDVHLNSQGPTVIRNTVIGGGSHGGIYKQNSGSLTVTNCLIHSQGSHGIEALAGAVAIANSTFANNTGWGLTNTSGTIPIIDSIIWGNITGGCTGGTINATYSNIQEPHAGTSNMVIDPLFVAGFYLATNTSPCIDAGSATAASLGLTNRTTRTDGGNDQGQVDIGFHYANGIPDTTISNLNLYVDVGSGNNANDGWSAGNAKKNISAALTNAIDGTTINIAAGNYSTNAGEVFPLAPQNFNLTLRGTNRDTTLINAGGTARVLEASAVGKLQMEALTFTNGLSNTSGGGLYLVSSMTTITNCAIRGNLCAAPLANYYGGGIYASGGSLGIFNSDISGNSGNNSAGADVVIGYGGGIYAINVSVTLKASTITSNSLSPRIHRNGYGGGLYLDGGNALLDGCSFRADWISVSYNGKARGGGICAGGVGSLTITNCAFAGNFASWDRTGGGIALGSVMYLGDSMAAQILNCQILSNTNSLGVEDLYLNSSGPVTLWSTVIGLGCSNGITKLNSGMLAMTNCLIYAEPSHGIAVTTGTVSIVNCTIAGNGGWGITNSAGIVSVKNSIAWTNTLGGISTNAGDTVTYTCSQELLGGAGNKSTDPLFEYAATNNYRLTRASPCINKGDNEAWMVNACDLDGNPRIQAGTVDMGAYEIAPARGTVFMVM